MRYYSSKADWLYKTIPTSDDLLATFSRELLKVLQITQVKNKTLFKNMLAPCWDLGVLTAHAPNLILWLQDQSLDEYFIGTYFTIADSNTHLSIHIDSDVDEDFDGSKINLLMPVSNCKNSWTIWYDADKTIEGVPENFVKNGYGKSFDLSTAVEVVRVESTTPYWINGLFPHAPVTGQLENASSPRIIASLRFKNSILQDEKIKSYYVS
jgi:hypothetical protein